jgi:DNA polymerase elongation subunit (family B)
MDCFIYSWNVYFDVIYAFGKKILESGNSSDILVKIPFQCYCYLLLPDMKWDESNIRILSAYFKDVLGEKRPCEIVLCKKYRLFGAHLEEDGIARKKFLFLKCFFRKRYFLNCFSKLFIGGTLQIPKLGILSFKICEEKSNSVLQFCCNAHLDPVGWVTLSNYKSCAKKESFCEEEFILHDWRSSIKKIDRRFFPDLVICSFDIECIAEDRMKFPDPKMPNDICFQISCVISTLNSPKLKKFLFSLGPKERIDEIEDVEIIQCDNERTLLNKFVDFIVKENINICIGYNIFQFDIPFLIERSKQNQCFEYFSKMGFLKNVECKERKIKWTSSAYQVQEYNFLDAEGRIFIDLLPVIQKEYKLENFKLETVAQHFLKRGKNDISYEEINRKFDEFSPMSLSVIGKYCVQDSLLVTELFNHLQIFFSLYSMANVTKVPINTLLLYGQQIKVYSSLYQYCVDNDFVVEHPGQKLTADERYIGASVLEPIPGLYDWVLGFDFKSLYPSIIISYNICYSTLILDPNFEGPCHNFVWEDHNNCEHDTSKKSASKIVLCQKRNYKFLKSPVGILPAVITELLKKRAETREEMKRKDIDEITRMVLNQRQLAYKVSANSMYGITGVREGMLPLMALAMCITFKGRETIMQAKNAIKEMFGGDVKYGDTDSCYVVFPNIDVEYLFEFGCKVSREVSAIFPKPIELEFENEIYSKFLILTKKRYCYQKIEQNGVINPEIFKKGILLCRRDTCKFIKDTYEKLILLIFSNCSFSQAEDHLTSQFQKLLSRQISVTDLVMTKSFNDFEGQVKNGKLGQYKMRKIAPEHEEYDEDFYVKQLPAMCQLANRLKKRGEFKFEGRRLEYLMLNTNDPTHKQGDKIEHLEYFLRHQEDFNIDYFYYFERLIEPVDQVLEVVFGKKNWMKQSYIFHYKIKKLFIKQIDKLHRPILIFQE